MQEAARLALSAFNNFGESSLTHGRAMVAQAETGIISCVEEFCVLTNQVTEDSNSTRADIINEAMNSMRSSMTPQVQHPEDVEAVEQLIAAHIQEINWINSNESEAILKIYAEQLTSIKIYAAEKSHSVGRSLLTLARAGSMGDRSFEAYMTSIKDNSAGVEGRIDAADSSLRSYIESELTDLRWFIDKKEKLVLDQSALSVKALRKKIDSILAIRQASDDAQNDANSGHTQDPSSHGDRASGERHHASNNGTSAYAADPRINKLMGSKQGQDRQPYEIFLANIDHLRDRHTDDRAIYRLLMKRFHPDLSGHQRAEDLSRIIAQAYNKTTNKFDV